MKQLDLHAIRSVAYIFDCVLIDKAECMKNRQWVKFAYWVSELYPDEWNFLVRRINEGLKRNVFEEIKL